MLNTSLLATVETPAFIYDEGEVSRALDVAESLRANTGCRVLYSLKPLCIVPLLEMMAPRLDGFAVSSPFEARLARSVLQDLGSIHFTSPGIRPTEVKDLVSLSDYVSFNSVSQWERYGSQFNGRTKCGLRLNPELSFLDDERYDPCRENSKLGVPLSAFAEYLRGSKTFATGFDGILVHSNCESTDFTELERTVSILAETVPRFIQGLKWINLGGGYLFNEGIDYTPLKRTVSLLENSFGLEVFLEPGAALVRAAGHLVATVLDIFPSGNKQIAVLDTTVNHMPELLEFDFEPDLEGHHDEGPFEYTLAGCTCLAGDLFGEYRFSHGLTIGDRLVFLNAGSYSLTKAHMFNGINMPSIYSLNARGQLTLLKNFGYEDFTSRWKVNVHSPV